MAATEGRKSNVGKAIGIGCLVVVLILGIGGYLVVKNIGKIGRSFGAKALVGLTQQMLAESGLPADEQEQIMKPVMQLSEEIKSGAISMEQMKVLVEELSAGPLASMVMVKAVQVKYLETSGMPSEEKDAARLTISRYAEACVREAPETKSAAEELSKIITIETTDSSGNKTTQMRETMSDEDLRKVLVIMKRTADSAAIPMQTFKIDIAKAINDAISKAKTSQE